MVRIPTSFSLFLVATALAAGSTHADPLRISNMQSLAFGSFNPGTGGNVVMTPNGARSATGAVFLFSTDPGTAAQFMVTGNSSQVYSITLPTAATLSSGTASMQISNFVSLPSGATNSTGQLSGGVQVLKVGATLQVGANQSKGSYSGTFNVTVNNN